MTNTLPSVKSGPRAWALLLPMTALLACWSEPTVAFANPNPALCGSQPVDVSVVVSGGTAHKVELFMDGTLIDWPIGPDFSLSCEDVTEGTHELVVKAVIQNLRVESEPKTIVVDHTSPTVTGPFPGLDPQYLPKDAPIQLFFSEPMRTDGVTPEGFSFTGVSIQSLTWSEDHRTLTFNLKEPIVPPRELSLDLSEANLRDLAGNHALMPPLRWYGYVDTLYSLWRAPRNAYGDAEFAVDHAGRSVVALLDDGLTSSDNSVVVYRSGTSGDGQLGGPLSAVPPPGHPNATEVAVAVDASDRPVVAWLEGVSGRQQAFVRRWNGSAWEELAGLPELAGDANPTGLVLETGNSDMPVIAWRQDTRTSSGMEFRVPVYRWNGQSWSAVGAPLQGMLGSLSFPSLAIDGEDHPLLAFNADGYPYKGLAVHVMRWDGSAWSQLGSDLRAGSVDASPFQHPLVVDPQGKPAVALGVFDGSARNIYFTRYGDTGWSAPQKIGGDNEQAPTLAFDAEGRPWITWISNYPYTELRILRIGDSSALTSSRPLADYARFANGGRGAPTLMLSGRTLRVVRPQ